MQEEKFVFTKYVHTLPNGSKVSHL